jgi:hypothetical protein
MSIIEIESVCVTMEGSVVVDDELDPNDIAYEGGTSSSSFLMIFFPTKNNNLYLFFWRNTRKSRQEMGDKFSAEKHQILYIPLHQGQKRDDYSGLAKRSATLRS